MHSAITAIVETSVTCWYCIKMTEARSTKTSLVDSPRLLIFQDKVYPEIQNSSSQARVLNDRVHGKLAIFGQSLMFKTIRDVPDFKQF